MAPPFVSEYGLIVPDLYRNKKGAWPPSSRQEDTDPRSAKADGVAFSLPLISQPKRNRDYVSADPVSLEKRAGSGAAAQPDDRSKTRKANAQHQKQEDTRPNRQSVCYSWRSLHFCRTGHRSKPGQAMADNCRIGYEGGVVIRAWWQIMV